MISRSYRISSAVFVTAFVPIPVNLVSRARSLRWWLITHPHQYFFSTGIIYYDSWRCRASYADDHRQADLNEAMQGYAWLYRAMHGYAGYARLCTAAQAQL